MCSEFERVERVVQNDVWPEEKDQNHSAYSLTSAPPIESRMIKKFRRAAAGLEEQLPSDLRPPSVLKRTCDYLFHEVVGNATLEKVHHFVWDRTRAIRNDFSIQQLTKPEDLRLAIDCYERIARFHILSIHQLAVLPRPYDKYDAQQEREQLDRTLLSLMQYYDDCRGRLELPNEAEFRAYCVIFQLQDPIPDLEDRVQSWPKQILRDRRVRTAMVLYAAACNTMDTQGPLKPRASHLIAQQDWQLFWLMVESPKVSYLMACVAEIYFNLVRRTALNALWRSFKSNPNRSPEDWTIEALLDVLVFDEEHQVHTFCEAYGFSFAQRADGLEYLDLTSLKERNLPSPSIGLPKQWKSGLVESKRFGRTIPAIIDGFTVKLAESTGQMCADEVEVMPDLVSRNEMKSEKEPPAEDESSLFIPEAKKQALDIGDVHKFDKIQSQQLSSIGNHGVFSFGKPSGSTTGKFSGGINSGDKTVLPPNNVSDSGDIKPVFNFTQTPGNVVSTLPAGSASAQEQATPLPIPFDSQVRLPTFESSKVQGAGTFSFIPNSISSSNHAQEQKTPYFNFDSMRSKDQASKSANNEDSPTQGFPWNKQSAEQITAEDQSIRAEHVLNQHDHGFKSAPLSSDQVPNVESSANEAGAASSRAHVAKAEVKLSQLPHMASPPGPTSPTNSNASAIIPRKASMQKETKPKTPSPLSNSFSFEDVSNPPTFSASNGKAPTLVGPGQNQESTSAKAYKPPENLSLTTTSDQRVDFESVISRIANEITLEQDRGFLDQYVEFAVQQAIVATMEQLENEQEAQRADRYRELMLSRRYFQKWKKIFWGKRFAKRASSRRERARQGLEEYKMSHISKKSLAGSNSSTLKSMKTNFFESVSQSASTISQPPPDAIRTEQHKEGGNKRTRSSHGADITAESHDMHQKRQKSSSDGHIQGHVTNPTLVNDTTAEILKRSSFLGFSLPPRAGGNGCRTRSNYFRLKAMGIEPRNLDRGTKHQRGVSIDESEGLSRASTPSRAKKSCLRASRESTAEGSTSTPIITHTSDALDEELFARLKTARENLMRSTEYMKAEITREEELKRSFGFSQSIQDSPSMTRARAEARLRTSTPGSIFAVSNQTNDVPAYRLRESKFVPREHYGRAIDRANEIRASRSRDTSRPESRAGSQAVLPPHCKSTFPTGGNISHLQDQQEHPVHVRSSNLFPASHLSKTEEIVAELHELQSSGIPNGQHEAFGLQQGMQSWVALNSDPIASSKFAVGYDKGIDSMSTTEQHDLAIQPNEPEQTLSNIERSQQGYLHPVVESLKQHNIISSQSDPSNTTEQSGLPNLSSEDDSLGSQPTYYNQSMRMTDKPGKGDGTGSEEYVDQSENFQKSQAFCDNDSQSRAENIHALDGSTDDDIGDVDVEAEDDALNSDILENDEAQGSKGYDYDDEDGFADEEDIDGSEEGGGEGDDEKLYDETNCRDHARIQARDLRYASDDDSEELYDEDEEDYSPNARVWSQLAQKNKSRTSVGGTAEEAIELSD